MPTVRLTRHVPGNLDANSSTDKTRTWKPRCQQFDYRSLTDKTRTWKPRCQQFDYRSLTDKTRTWKPRCQQFDYRSLTDKTRTWKPGRQELDGVCVHVELVDVVLAEVADAQTAVGVADALHRGQVAQQDLQQSCLPCPILANLKEKKKKKKSFYLI